MLESHKMGIINAIVIELLLLNLLYETNFQGGTEIKKETFQQYHYTNKVNH